MKSLFGTYTYTWWQIGLLKVLLVSIGLMIGAFASGVVQSIFWPLLVVSVAIYLVIMWQTFRPGSPTRRPQGK
jgi:hypothetical protein